MNGVMAHPASYIESPSNPLIKDVRRAVSHSAPTRDGWWVAESFHLLDEAFASRLKVREVLAAARARKQVEARLRGHGDVSLKIVEDALFQQIASTETTQGVLALVEPPKWNLDDLFRGVPLLVALDGIQDPGNAGAVVRCAEAFGASGVVFLKGTAHAANPKTLRASAGSLFRLPHVSGMESAQLMEEAKGRQVQLFAAGAQAGKTLSDIRLNQGCVIAFGSEAHGVSEALRAAAEPIRIPTKIVESLNVSAAAAVVLYEAARQRATKNQSRNGRQPYPRKVPRKPHR
jgi:TrmH family RNA methyltransferase